MVLTPSVMIPIGTKAPAFSLPDVVTGKSVTLDAAAGAKGTLVMFICRHCPYVQHVQDEVARLGRDYAGKGIGLVAISSNDAGKYPDDAPAKLKEMAVTLGFKFPYLHDESQSVARAYSAACTPDFFLFDAARGLAYRGQLDDSRLGNGKPVTGKDLRGAMDAVLAGNKPDVSQKASIGCNIKWKE
jgi:peroxiredoxin